MDRNKTRPSRKPGCVQTCQEVGGKALRDAVAMQHSIWSQCQVKSQTVHQTQAKVVITTVMQTKLEASIAQSGTLWKPIDLLFIQHPINAILSQALVTTTTVMAVEASQRVIPKSSSENVPDVIRSLN